MRSGVYTSVLSADDWRAVDSLVELCRAHDGLEIPMHRFPHPLKQEVNQFLYFQADELVGVATLPPGPEIEVLGGPEEMTFDSAGNLVPAFEAVAAH